MLLLTLVMCVTEACVSSPSPTSGLYVRAESDPVTADGSDCNPFASIAAAIAALTPSGGTALIEPRSDSWTIGGLTIFSAVTLNAQGSHFLLDSSSDIKEDASLFLLDCSVETALGASFNVSGSLSIQRCTLHTITSDFALVFGVLEVRSSHLTDSSGLLASMQSFGASVSLLSSDFSNFPTLLAFEPGPTSSTPDSPSSVLIRDCTLSNFQTSIRVNIDRTIFSGTYLGESKLTLETSTFQNFNLGVSGSLYFWTVSVSKCVFQQGYMALELALNDRDHVVASSTFRNLQLAANITNLVSTVSFAGCTFTLSGHSLMLAQGTATSWFSATECTFYDIGNSTSVGSAIFAQNAGKVSLRNSNVTNARAKKGGAVAAHSSVLMEVTGCYLANLSASDGAVMDIEYSNVNIQGTEVVGATAEGSVFYVYEQVTNYKELTVRRSYGAAYFFFAFESATVLSEVFVEDSGTQGQFMILAVSTIPCYVYNSVFRNVSFGNAFVLPYAAQIYHYSNITVHVSSEVPSDTLFSNFGTLVNITKSTFSGTMQTVLGGVGPAGVTIMTDCVFTDLQVVTLFAPGSAVLQISNTVIRNSRVSDAKASPLSTTPVLMSNVSLSNITGQFLSSTQSTLTFVRFTASNCTVPADFNFIDAVQSQMSFAFAAFDSVTLASSSALISATLQSSVSVSSSSFVQISASGDAGILVVEQSAGTFDLVQASYLTSSFIAAVESSLSITNSAFTDIGQVPNPNFDGGIVNTLQMLGVTLTNCNFTRVQARNGGVAYISYTNPNKASIRRQMGSQGYVTVSLCRFTSCQSTEDGAGLYLSYTTATVSDTHFTGNVAGQNGGALALYCDPYVLQFTCWYYINRTDFSDNTAGAGGGAVKYDKIKPVMTNSTRSNNTALYGSFLAAFPVELRVMQGSAATKPPVLAGESGSPWNAPLRVGLFDELQQLVVASSSDGNSLHGTLAVSNKTTLVSGLQTVQVEDGICSFASLSITDAPGSLVNLRLTSDSIDYAHVNPNTQVFSAELSINMILRACVAGEIIKNSVCDMCVAGTYSFNTSDTVCKSCPRGLTCRGGANTIVSRDYWRPDNTSELLLDCYARDICLGGNEADCDTGYGGKLCTFCNSGYFRYGNFFCLPCGSTVWGIFRGVLVLAGTALFLIIMILGNLRNTAKRKSNLSIHFRIFLNYNQVTMLMSSFQIKWPVDLVSFFEGLKMTGNASQFAFSNECLTGEASMNYIYQKVLLVAFIPIILISLAVVIWGIVSLIRRRTEYLRVHVLCSVIVLLLSMQPIVLQSSLQMYPCVEVEPGSTWLLHDMHIACWEGDHRLFAFAVALPSILIWCILTPFIFWLLLFRQRYNLSDQLNVRRIGFLYSGYHQHFYYWEFVVVLRKSLMVIVANLMVTTQSKVQSQVAISVLWFFVILQYKEMPFETRRFNRTEFLSLFSSLVTVICGALYLSDLHAQKGAYYALLVIVFFTNSLYLFVWLVLLTVYLAQGKSQKVANLGTWLDKMSDKYWRV